MTSPYDRHEKLQALCREAFPDLSEAELEVRVRELWRELERLRRNWSNSQKRFHSHVSLMAC